MASSQARRPLKPANTTQRIAYRVHGIYAADQRWRRNDRSTER